MWEAGKKGCVHVLDECSSGAEVMKHASLRAFTMFLCVKVKL